MKAGEGSNLLKEVVEEAGATNGDTDEKGTVDVSAKDGDKKGTEVISFFRSLSVLNGSRTYDSRVLRGKFISVFGLHC